MPQYQRVIDIVHRAKKKFLLHRCGNIFNIMNDHIDLQIDAINANGRYMRCLVTGVGQKLILPV